MGVAYIRRSFTILNRREFLGGSLAAATSFGGSRLLGQAQPATTKVHTSLGTLRGLELNDVRVFRGVPFAEPPVGDRRFLPPLPAKPWKGERDATSFSASPMQPGEKGTQHSEDCLYLNVWAPQGKGPFPVFVWIHGGGFTGGHSFEKTYDGTGFAKEGVVCITVGYRLGVFGFLDFEPILGSRYEGSGNNAVRDLIAALEWIRRNIANFGGDPSRVTIGGESAGAKLSDILLGVPDAEPLFHSVISESGGAERVWPQVLATPVAKGFADAWTKATSKPVSALLTASAESIVPVQKQFMDEWPQHFPLRPEIDGRLIAKLPVQVVGSGLAKSKRLLIGTNRDESALFVGPHPGDATAQNVGNLALSSFTETYARYKAVYPQMNDEQRRIRALTAEEYWVPSLRLADSHVDAGGAAWVYEFDFAETSGRLSGYAYHSLEVGLVWQHPHADAANAQAEMALGRQIHAAWVAFIKGEVPGAQGLPVWPRYRADTRPTMILDTVSRVEERPQEAEFRLWDGKL
jgi:para-nitrobenzyl esterase